MSNILAITYDQAVTVTKSDSTDDPKGPFAGLFVGVAGTLKFTTMNGVDVSTTVVAGQTVPIVVKRVWSTGTASTVYGLITPPFRAGTPSS